MRLSEQSLNKPLFLLLKGANISNKVTQFTKPHPIGKIAGRAVLIAGTPGTGKTAIAMGVAQVQLVV